MAKKPSTAVAKAEPSKTSIAIPMEDMGMGMEGATQEMFAIPFLSVLQKISPQCDEAESAYVNGAKAGMFFESVTKSLYEGERNGIQIIPCAIRRTFLRWAPRGAEGGGYKGEMTPDQVAALRESGKLVEFENRLWFPLEDGTVNTKRCDHVADTRNHYVLLIDGDTARECLLSLTSTQIKKSRQLMTLLAGKKVNGQTRPIFATLINATTARESNDKGQWNGINFTDAGDVPSIELYDAAKAFHKAVTAGKVKEQYESPVEDGEF